MRYRTVVVDRGLREALVRGEKHAIENNDRHVLKAIRRAREWFEDTSGPLEDRINRDEFNLPDRCEVCGRFLSDGVCKRRYMHHG